MQAVGLKTLAGQNNQVHLRRDAELYFTKAISGVAQALQDITQATSDTVLAATFLFTLYTISAMSPSTDTGMPSIHFGTIHLVKLRGDAQLLTPLARNMYEVYHSHLSSPLEGTEDCIRMLEREEPPSTSEFAWCHLLGARFCADVQALFKEPVQDDAWLLQMLQQVREAVIIDQRFQAWYDNGTTGLRSQHEVRSPNLNTDKGLTYAYHDLCVGSTWNNFRATRIHVNEVLCHCIQLIKWHPSFKADSYLDEIREKATNTIQALVAGIRASTPFCLGEIDAKGNEITRTRDSPLLEISMLWPLYRAIRSSREGSEEQMWLIGKLRYLPDVLGLEVAGRFLERKMESSWDLRRYAGVDLWELSV